MDTSRITRAPRRILHALLVHHGPYAQYVKYSRSLVGATTRSPVAALFGSITQTRGVSVFQLMIWKFVCTWYGFPRPRAFFLMPGIHAEFGSWVSLFNSRFFVIWGFFHSHLYYSTSSDKMIATKSSSSLAPWIYHDTRTPLYNLWLPLPAAHIQRLILA